MHFLFFPLIVVMENETHGHNYFEFIVVSVLLKDNQEQFSLQTISFSNVLLVMYFSLS